MYARQTPEDVLFDLQADLVALADDEAAGGVDLHGAIGVDDASDSERECECACGFVCEFELELEELLLEPTMSVCAVSWYMSYVGMDMHSPMALSCRT